MSAGARSKLVIDTGHLEHGVHQHAARVSVRIAGTAGAEEGALEKVLQRIDRRQLGAGALQQLQGARGEQIEALDVEAALIGERRVKAAAADAHRRQKIGQ